MTSEDIANLIDTTPKPQVSNRQKAFNDATDNHRDAIRESYNALREELNDDEASLIMLAASVRQAAERIADRMNKVSQTGFSTKGPSQILTGKDLAELILEGIDLPLNQTAYCVVVEAIRMEIGQ